MPQKKVLVSDGVHPVLIEGLTARGYVCDYQPNIPLEKVHEIIGDYHGLVINSKIIFKKELIDKAIQLEFVARLGSGMEIVDIPYAESKGIQVISSPEGNRNAVGEHALGMLLALANNMAKADREVRNLDWRREENRGFELKGKTIGIIGFGHTGMAFAKKLQGLEMRVLVYDKYRVDYTHPFTFVAQSDLNTIQKEADIISFHLPLTQECHHYANADFIKNCQKGCILINTSRGQVIHTQDLIQALSSGQVGGACLDVFENEKTGTFTKAENEMYQELYTFPQVILTPHVAGWTHESKYKLAKVILDKLR